MVSECGIDVCVEILMDGQSGIIGKISIVPFDGDSVERRRKEPTVFPIIKGEISDCEVLLHFIQKVIDSRIFPTKFIEVVLNSFEEIVFTHEEHQLFESGWALLVCDSIKISLGYTCILDNRPYRMSCLSNLVLSIARHASD